MSVALPPPRSPWRPEGEAGLRPHSCSGGSAARLLCPCRPRARGPPEQHAVESRVHSPRCALLRGRGPGRHLVQPAAVLQREAEDQGRLRGGRGLSSPPPAHRWGGKPTGPSAGASSPASVLLLGRGDLGGPEQVHSRGSCSGPSLLQVPWTCGFSPVPRGQSGTSRRRLPRARTLSPRLCT